MSWIKCLLGRHDWCRVEFVYATRHMCQRCGKRDTW